MKYLKEIIILILQSAAFYLIPLFSDPYNPMGMVLLILLATFVLSSLLGGLSKEKVKYFYPLVVSVIFIPSVFIYYNESALVHSLWYLVVSTVGVALGALIRKIAVQ